MSCIASLTNDTAVLCGDVHLLAERLLQAGGGRGGSYVHTLLQRAAVVLVVSTNENGIFGQCSGEVLFYASYIYTWKTSTPYVYIYMSFVMCHSRGYNIVTMSRTDCCTAVRVPL